MLLTSFQSLVVANLRAGLLCTQDPLYMQGLERGRALMDALNPQHGFGQQHNMHAPGLQHAPWMQHQPNQDFANQHHAQQAPGALPHPEPMSLAAWLNGAQPTEAQQQQQQQSLLPQQFLASLGQHPGQGQQPPQHHLQRPMPQQQQQQQQQQQHQQQHRIVSDPVINPATLLQAGRVPSGPLPPIGQGVDSHGSSSNNLAQQVRNYPGCKCVGLFLQSIEAAYYTQILEFCSHMVFAVHRRPLLRCPETSPICSLSCRALHLHLRKLR